jgi:FkbM family methyltransferase
MTQIIIPPDLESLILSQRNVYSAKTKKIGNRMVIMGTGHLGRTLAERLSNLPVTVECFCDNNPLVQGSVVMGRPVLSVPDAVKKYNGIASFIIGIYHSSSPQIQLQKLGCQAVVTAATLCRHFGPPLTPLESIDFPDEIYFNRASVVECEGIWADEKSRSEYAKVLNWFMAANQETLLEHDPAEETYFPKDLWSMSEDDHFADCGAFNGDSVLMFLENVGMKFKQATAYEPDPRNIEALNANLAALPVQYRKKVKVVNAALAAKSGYLQFSVSGTAGSAVNEEADFKIKCVFLDEEHCNSPATFLKMDIEGYELEALNGASEMIAKHAPILAVTCYHKVQHLWQIPLLIKSFRSDYKFYLRRYSEDCWETVCYAVPMHRAI